MRKIIIFLVLITINYSAVFSQTSGEDFDPVKRYDEILELNLPDKTNALIKKMVPKDELALYLPNLGSPLYEGWIEVDSAMIWEAGKENSFQPLPEDLLAELGAEKILRQIYEKGESGVQVTVYRFKNFAGAYSASTVFGKGSPAKLKVGKNVYESEDSLSFWKEKYFIDIRTAKAQDTETKGFTVLASQEISDKIENNYTKPVVAVQLPALNRIPGLNKYCLGPICCRQFFPQDALEIDPDNYKLSSAGGIITADYKLTDNPADDRKVTLILMRYEDKATPRLVYSTFFDFYKKKDKENKGVKLNVRDGIARVKNNKENYTMFKYKGNMFAAVYGSPDKNSGVKIIELIPWPVEITR